MLLHLFRTESGPARLAAGLAVLWGLVGIAAPVPAQDVPDAAGIEYFEKHIRPVLATQCYDCHSGSVAANQTGLRVDIAYGLLMGGGSGPSLIKGKPDESALLKALRYEGSYTLGVGVTSPGMPPGGKLDDETIAHFEEWIRMGAPDPRGAAPERAFGKREIEWESEGAHWSFQPLKATTPPTVKDGEWPKGDIDRFILGKLEQAQLKPAADTGAASWLRRVSFDLTGLPPTPGELLDFELDSSDDARRKAVQRLLESPRFGERWGRHWLDLVRYGESTGKERNYVYLQAWRYRDYVIDSFNRDKPIDQFIIEQVAGDLLPHKDDAEKDQHLIATGFLALNPKGLNDRTRESFILDIVDEQVESVGRGLMGLSVSCARCHDHKYDPIPQTDYYAIAGIFRSTDLKFGMASQTRLASDPAYLLPLTSTDLTRGERYPAAVVAELIAKEEELENVAARIAFLKHQAPHAPPPPVPTVKEVVAAAEAAGGRRRGGGGGAGGAIPTRQIDRTNELGKQIAELESESQKRTQEITKLRNSLSTSIPNTTAMGVIDRPEASDMAIRVRGVVDRLGEIVPRGFLTVASTGNRPRIDATRSGRLELAEWIASPRNPLTARVYVNRVWSKLLGVGITPTVDDFGLQGEPPTHPELLDHLTSKFIQQGWSTKRLVQEIVLSHVYALSGRTDSEGGGDNSLLRHWNQRRLEGEVIRDTMLAVSGRLDLTRPYGSPLVALGTRELGPRADYSVVEGAYRYRSVYLPYMRGRVPEMLVLFDAANPSLTVGKRDVTAGPDQSLYLLNSPFALDESRRLAQRILAAPVADDAARIDLAFRLVLGESPTREQRETALAFLRDLESLHRQEESTRADAPKADRPKSETAKVDGEQTEGEKPDGANANAPQAGSEKPVDPRASAWTDFSQMLFSLPEFRYLD